MMSRRLHLLALLFAASLDSACSSGPAADDGCTFASDCPMGQLCGEDRTCVPGECATDADCAANDPRTYCDLATLSCAFVEGFGDECDASNPCPFGQFCSELLGLCLESSGSLDCVRRSQCPANQICDRSANKCIPDPGCYGDAYCEDGETCDLVNRTCGTASEGCTSCLIEACTGGLVCYAATQECLDPSAGEPSCRSGLTCDPLGRCVECLSSDDCGPGTFCNISVGTCESNIQCADDVSECPTSEQVQCVICELPQVCDSRTKRCSAPAQTCDSDLDCPNDQLCDLTLDTPVCIDQLPSCIDDLYDDPANDDIASARKLLEADGPIYADLKLCPGDQDWFSVDVAAGTLLTVDARFVHQEGDLELQMLLSDGTSLVDQSRSTTDNERVELEVGTDLTLYLRTFLGTQSIQALDYRLVISRTEIDACADDAAEPDDGPGEAGQLLFAEPYEGRICPADPDWFSLRMVPAGSRIVLDLDFVDSLGNLDLEVYRAGSTTPLMTSRSTTDGERIELDALYGGDYFVRVIGEAADTNVYTLRATLLPGMGTGCLDDSLEPNDGPSTAAPAGSLLGVPQSLSICSGDEDWFAVNLTGFQIFEAEVGIDGQADLDLALLEPGTTDPNASPIALSDGTAPREYLAYRPTMSGQYFVRVYGSRGSDANPYTLTMTSTAWNNCQPDRYDAAGLGQTDADAVTLAFPPSEERDLTLCSGDTDWYRVFVRGGFTNVLRLQYPSSLATLDFVLFDANNLSAPLFNSTGQALQDLREVQITVPGNGIGVVLVQVQSTDNFTAPYSLSMDLIPGFACTPDVNEPNDSAAAATAVTGSSPITLSGLTLCPGTRRTAGSTDVGDEDWLTLTPPAVGARMEAEIQFTNGDLLLELLSPGGAVRACNNEGDGRCYSDGNGLNERVTFTATTTDPYFLRVSSIYSASGIPRPPDADTDYQLDVRYTAP